MLPAMLEEARNNMIKQQLRTCNVLDESILQLLSEVPREDFVPPHYRALALSDTRIPLNHGETMMTPLEEAAILQAMDIQKHHRILEIGTGSGYLTALLAKKAGQVISIEYYEDFTKAASHQLANHGIHNVTLITGDGIHGWLDLAPYDRIILTGSISRLDKTFHPQLVEGGKCFAILGIAPVMEGCVLSLDEKDQWQSQMLFETNIKPLINRFEKKAFNF